MTENFFPVWATPPACWRYGERYVSTVLGSGAAGHTNDGALGVLAASWPGGLAVDEAFNVYVVNRGNYRSNDRIRMVDPVTGCVKSVAGTANTAVYNSNCATLAKLNTVSGLAVGIEGALYIAEMTASGMVKMVQNGIISTIAGGGTDASTGELVPTLAMLGPVRALALQTNGDLLLAEGNRIRRITGLNTASPKMSIIANRAGAAGFSGDQGPAVDALLNSPYGLAVDRSDNIYVADNGNKRIRTINPTGVISTYAGGGTRTDFSGSTDAVAVAFDPPMGITTDPLGNVFFVTNGYQAGSGSNCLLMVGTNQKISSVAGDGIYTPPFCEDPTPAFAARIITYTQATTPAIVASDRNGNVYVSDSSNRVRMVSAVGVPPQ